MAVWSLCSPDMRSHADNQDCEYDDATDFGTFEED